MYDMWEGFQLWKILASMQEMSQSCVQGMCWIKDQPIQNWICASISSWMQFMCRIDQGNGGIY